MLETDCTFLATENSIDKSFELLDNKLHDIYDTSVPHRKPGPSSKYPPWFTYQVIRNNKEYTEKIQNASGI